jgi:hypothetical protein
MQAFPHKFIYGFLCFVTGTYTSVEDTVTILLRGVIFASLLFDTGEDTTKVHKFKKFIVAKNPVPMERGEPDSS